MKTFQIFLFLYSYEEIFVQKLLQDRNKKLAVSFNHTFRYIDDVLSINNHNFHNFYGVQLFVFKIFYINDKKARIAGLSFESESRNPPPKSNSYSIHLSSIKKALD
jgi:hypothetical protein